MNGNQVLCFSLLLLLAGCKLRCKEKNFAAADSSLESVKLTDLENKIIDIRQYSGKTVFINFWATWCKPCIAEMPSIQKAQEILKNKEVVFLLASSESIG